MSNPASPIIYVIDDDEVVRDSIKVLLEISGYTVQDFDSGDKFLSERRDLSRCCLIVDIHMPGMTGLDLMGDLRSRGVTAPAILITGRRDAHINARTATMEHVVLMDKPVPHERLFSAISDMLANQ
jgi:two-component system response regulator FixJ